MGCCKGQHAGGSGPGDCITAALAADGLLVGALISVVVALESPALEPTEFEGGHTDNAIYCPYKKLVLLEAGVVLV